MKYLVTILAAISLWSSAYCEGESPVADNLDLTVVKNGTAEGRLTAHDNTDGTLRFEITTEPIKGEIRLEPDGAFIYTPDEGKKGRDYFGYKVYDEDGNASQEATVIIRIVKE